MKTLVLRKATGFLARIARTCREEGYPPHLTSECDQIAAGRIIPFTWGWYCVECARMRYECRHLGGHDSVRAVARVYDVDGRESKAFIVWVPGAKGE